MLLLSNLTSFLSIYPSLFSSLLSASLSALYSTSPSSSSSPPPFSWYSLSPSPNLTYTPCPHINASTLECALLELPLDWSNLSNPHRIGIAVARVPATVDISDPSFGGTIILNPGGPSGSGVTFVAERGRWHQAIVDSDTNSSSSSLSERHYEMLSFDPRGVHHSTPNVSCFPSDFNRDVYVYRKQAIGQVDIAPEALEQRWALAQGLGKLCAEEEVSGGLGDGLNIRSFVTTALVAQDMVALVDKIDEEKRSALKSRNETVLGKAPTADAQAPLRGDESSAPIPLIQYWGFSYGSILGNVFASLYPSRIGRFILDGVSDLPDYSAMPGWTTNLYDTEAVYDYFYTSCFSGRSRCPLYHPTDESADAIRHRVTHFLNGLKTAPLPAVHNGTTTLITYSDVNMQIFSALYFPLQQYPNLARMLADLLHGNTTSIVAMLPGVKNPATKPLADEGFLPISSPRPDPILNITHSPIPLQEYSYPAQDETSTAIMCGDSTILATSNTTALKSVFESHLATLITQSPHFGALWSNAKLPCLTGGYPASLLPSRKNRFDPGSGKSWGSKLADYPPRSRGGPEGILFVTTRLDPVTPRRNAVTMAKGHEGARVLVQDSVGHCSVMSAPSGCTREVLRGYLATGELGMVGDEMICGIDREPWDEDEVE